MSPFIGHSETITADSSTIDEQTVAADDESELARASPSAIAKTIASNNNKTKNDLTSSTSSNNKELVKAEASCLLRMADPSMMLVQSATAEETEQLEGGGEEDEDDEEEEETEESKNSSSASRQPKGATESVTDCGSLSKSSSDGDPVGVVSRKRPPTKLKSRRRNILSFPHHISVDELRLIQVILIEI